jgi:hypothetical protein
MSEEAEDHFVIPTAATTALLDDRRSRDHRRSTRELGSVDRQMIDLRQIYQAATQLHGVVEYDQIAGLAPLRPTTWAPG